MEKRRVMTMLEALTIEDATGEHDAISIEPDVGMRTLDIRERDGHVVYIPLDYVPLLLKGIERVAAQMHDAIQTVESTTKDLEAN